MIRTSPRHPGSPIVRTIGRVTWWLRFNAGVTAAGLMTVVGLVCGGGLLLVHAAPGPVTQVATFTALDTATHVTVPAPAAEDTSPLTLWAAASTVAPAPPTTVKRVASAKAKPTAGKSKTAVASTTVPSPSTTSPALTATVAHQPPSTTVPTTIPASLAPWYSDHVTDVRTLQGAIANLWVLALGQGSHGSPASLSAALGALRHSIAQVGGDLPTTPNNADSALSASLTTLGQSLKDFASWQTDPSGPGFDNAVGDLYRGDAAFYSTLMANGVASSALPSSL